MCSPWLAETLNGCSSFLIKFNSYIKMGGKSYTFRRVPGRRTKTIAGKLQWNVVACLKKKTWETCEGRSSRRVSRSYKWELSRCLWSEIVLIISMPCRSHIKGMGLTAWSWCKKGVFGAGLASVIWEPPYHRFPFLCWKKKPRLSDL